MTVRVTSSGPIEKNTWCASKSSSTSAGAQMISFSISHSPLARNKLNTAVVSHPLFCREFPAC